MKRARVGGDSPGSSSPPPDDDDDDDVPPGQLGAGGADAASVDGDYEPPSPAVAAGGGGGGGGGGTPDEEDDGEELIGEGMESDYRPMGALDEYEVDGLDEHDYGPMDFSARAAAEAALEQRDERERFTRMPMARLTAVSVFADARPRRRRRADRAADVDAEVDPEDAAAAGLEDFLGDDDEPGINLEDYQGPLAEWISSPAVSEEVRKRFGRFLRSVGADGGRTYADKVRAMCSRNRESLEVNYHDLSHAVPILAIWVADAPKEMLKLLDEAAMDTVRIMFPRYDNVTAHVHVRIARPAPPRLAPG